MIETAWTFWNINVRKHGKKIIATTHPYLSGLLAAWLVMYSGITIKPFALANFFIPYDTVVFGFTATAIALSIALPSERFIKFLSQIKDGTTPFKDFLFIMVWNGVVHIFAFFMFVAVVIMGDGITVTSTDEASKMHVFIFIVLWLQFYACLQFFVTTIGIYELADLYAAYCAGLRKADDAAGR
jgi:magnesium-transporting ATPase (P-type)